MQTAFFWGGVSPPLQEIQSVYPQPCWRRSFSDGQKLPENRMN